MKKFLLILFVSISCKLCQAVSSFRVLDDKIVFSHDDWNLKFPTATASNPYPPPSTQEVFIATMCFQNGNYSKALTMFTQKGLKLLSINLAIQLQGLQSAQAQTGIDYSSEINAILSKFIQIKNIYPSLQ